MHSQNCPSAGVDRFRSILSNRWFEKNISTAGLVPPTGFWILPNDFGSAGSGLDFHKTYFQKYIFKRYIFKSYIFKRYIFKRYIFQKIYFQKIYFQKIYFQNISQLWSSNTILQNITRFISNPAEVSSFFPPVSKEKNVSHWPPCSLDVRYTAVGP